MTAIREKIEAHLALIEDTYNVTILFACESGSRAWGFESPFIVTLRADASITHYFQRRPLSRTQQILTTHDDGGLTLQITATSEQEVLHEVKKWMPNLHIVAPAELKKRSLQLAHIFMLHSSLQE